MLKTDGGRIEMHSDLKDPRSQRWAQGREEEKKKIAIFGLTRVLRAAYLPLEAQESLDIMTDDSNESFLDG